MADTIDTRVIGLDRLQATLRNLKGDLADIAPDAAADVIGTAAKSRAPKRTGRLAASFSSSTSDGLVSVRFGAAHAGPINFGVGPRPGLRGPHNIAATRFLTGAVSDKQSAWMADYADAAQDAVDNVKGA